MDSDFRALFAKRARRAYEMARLKSAAAHAWPVPIAAFLAIRLGASGDHVITLGLPLLVAAIGLVWRGGPAGRGVAPGLLAGTVPLVLPGLTMHCVKEVCSPSCAMWCSVSCIAGGVLAGVVVGFRAARFGEGWERFALAAGAIAATTGAMGCFIGGAVGVAGMLAGLVLGFAPALVLVPRKA